MYQKYNLARQRAIIVYHKVTQQFIPTHIVGYSKLRCVVRGPERVDKGFKGLSYDWNMGKGQGVVGVDIWVL